MTGYWRSQHPEESYALHCQGVPLNGPKTLFSCLAILVEAIYRPHRAGERHVVEGSACDGCDVDSGRDLTRVPLNLHRKVSPWLAPGPDLGQRAVVKTGKHQNRFPADPRICCQCDSIHRMSPVHRFLRDHQSGTSVHSGSKHHMLSTLRIEASHVEYLFMVARSRDRKAKWVPGSGNVS